MHALLFAALLNAAQRANIDAITRFVMGEDRILGLSLAVVRDGSIVYARGYGFADRRRSVRVTPHTIFAVASLEKPFIAASILRLAERGRLRLDDRLGRYVPWYVNARDVTIAELLAHRSGIPDYAQQPGFDRLARQPVSPAQLVRRVTSLPLLFRPGSENNYSNTDYVLLGMILERVTGMPLGAWLHRDLFAPLHLNETASWFPFLYEPGRAQGSLVAGTGSIGFGAADLESNAVDMGHWLDDLFTLRVVDARDLARLFGGMGFFTGRIGRYQGAWHSGYVAGYSAYVAVLPSLRLGVVLLSNADEVDLGPLAESVLHDALGRR